MPTTASLPIKDAHGTPDMELVLIDDSTLLLRGAELLEQEVDEAEQRATHDNTHQAIIARLLHYLASRELEETERAIERLAAGVPITEVEGIGLDSSGFKIHFKGHGHPLVHLDLNAIDWVGACTFAEQVEAAQARREQTKETPQ
ncbi:MAG TPA: hypothetical protein VFU32_02975 [Ktedonobacterales bacterium]|nr:hypothetical protein [Ktedonobacterales bacterium]